MRRVKFTAGRSVRPTHITDSRGCAVCQSHVDEHLLLLCDGYDAGNAHNGYCCKHEIHTYCLVPPLTKVPAEEFKWYCPCCDPVGTTASLVMYVLTEQQKMRRELCMTNNLLGKYENIRCHDKPCGLVEASLDESHRLSKTCQINEEAEIVVGNSLNSQTNTSFLCDVGADAYQVWIENHLEASYMQSIAATSGIYSNAFYPAPIVKILSFATDPLVAKWFKNADGDVMSVLSTELGFPSCLDGGEQKYDSSTISKCAISADDTLDRDATKHSVLLGFRVSNGVDRYRSKLDNNDESTLGTIGTSSLRPHSNATAIDKLPFPGYISESKMFQALFPTNDCVHTVDDCKHLNLSAEQLLINTNDRALIGKCVRIVGILSCGVQSRNLNSEGLAAPESHVDTEKLSSASTGSLINASSSQWEAKQPGSSERGDVNASDAIEINHCGRIVACRQTNPFDFSSSTSEAGPKTKLANILVNEHCVLFPKGADGRNCEVVLWLNLDDFCCYVYDDVLVTPNPIPLFSTIDCGGTVPNKRRKKTAGKMPPNVHYYCSIKRSLLCMVEQLTEKYKCGAVGESSGLENASKRKKKHIEFLETTNAIGEKNKALPHQRARFFHHQPIDSLPFIPLEAPEVPIIESSGLRVEVGQISNALNCGPQTSVEPSQHSLEAEHIIDASVNLNVHERYIQAECNEYDYWQSQTSTDYVFKCDFICLEDLISSGDRMDTKLRIDGGNVGVGQINPTTNSNHSCSVLGPVYDNIYAKLCILSKQAVADDSLDVNAVSIHCSDEPPTLLEKGNFEIESKIQFDSDIVPNSSFPLGSEVQDGGMFHACQFLMESDCSFPNITSTLGQHTIENQLQQRFKALDADLALERKLKKSQKRLAAKNLSGRRKKTEKRSNIEHCNGTDVSAEQVSVAHKKPRKMTKKDMLAKVQKQLMCSWNNSTGYENLSKDSEVNERTLRLLSQFPQLRPYKNRSCRNRAICYRDPETIDVSNNFENEHIKNLSSGSPGFADPDPNNGMDQIETNFGSASNASQLIQEQQLDDLSYIFDEEMKEFGFEAVSGDVSDNLELNVDLFDWNEEGGKGEMDVSSKSDGCSASSSKDAPNIPVGLISLKKSKHLDTPRVSMHKHHPANADVSMSNRKINIGLRRAMLDAQHKSIHNAEHVKAVDYNKRIHKVSDEGRGITTAGLGAAVTTTSTANDSIDMQLSTLSYQRHIHHHSKGSDRRYPLKTEKTGDADKKYGNRSKTTADEKSGHMRRLKVQSIINPSLGDLPLWNQKSLHSVNVNATNVDGNLKTKNKNLTDFGYQSISPGSSGGAIHTGHNFSMGPDPVQIRNNFNSNTKTAVRVMKIEPIELVDSAGIGLGNGNNVNTSMASTFLGMQTLSSSTSFNISAPPRDMKHKVPIRSQPQLSTALTMHSSSASPVVNSRYHSNQADFRSRSAGMSDIEMLNMSVPAKYNYSGVRNMPNLKLREGVVENAIQPEPYRANNSLKLQEFELFGYGDGLDDSRYGMDAFSRDGKSEMNIHRNGEEARSQHGTYSNAQHHSQHTSALRADQFPTANGGSYVYAASLKRGMGTHKHAGSYRKNNKESDKEEGEC